MGSIFGFLAIGAVGYLFLKKKPAIIAGSGYRLIQNVKLTHYYIADLSLGSVPVYDKSKNFVIGISSDAMKKLKLEGSGRLPDGRILNYYNGSLWSVLSSGSAPLGASGNRLTELGSIAVDKTLIPLGSVVYIVSLGIWTTADDIGNGIKGAHIDLFTGTASKGRGIDRITDLVVFDIAQ